MKLSLSSEQDLKLFYSLVAPVKGAPMKKWTLAYTSDIEELDKNEETF